MQPEWPIYEEIEEPLGDLRPPHVALVEQTPGSLGALTGAAVREAPGAVELRRGHHRRREPWDRGPAFTSRTGTVTHGAKAIVVGYKEATCRSRRSWP